MGTNFLNDVLVEFGVFGCWKNGRIVFGEFWGIGQPERCTIVDLVPTGSYQATLDRIVFSYIGFEGFPFGPFSCGSCDKSLLFFGNR